MGICSSKKKEDKKVDSGAAVQQQKPACPSRSPIQFKVEAGKDYYWCSCGKSSNQPFCDGSHQGTTFIPIKYTATETKDVYFCNCKRTKKPVMCDGTHADNSLDW